MSVKHDAAEQLASDFQAENPFASRATEWLTKHQSQDTRTMAQLAIAFELWKRERNNIEYAIEEADYSIDKAADQ